MFDTIRRYLLWRGFGVTYVSNVTDIEDKIIARAKEAGTTEPELVAKFEGTFRGAFDRLNILRPDEEPRATEWIDEMTKLIAELVANGHAYVVEGQGVYFQVDTLPEYGTLSHRTLEELLESAGAASTSTSASARRSTSRSGSRRSPASRRGSRRGGSGVRVGTSSARRCR